MVLLPGASVDLGCVSGVAAFAGQAWWPSSQWLQSRDFIRSVKAGRL
jgi:hypothetical protein